MPSKAHGTAGCNSKLLLQDGSIRKKVPQHQTPLEEEQVPEKPSTKSHSHLELEIEAARTSTGPRLENLLYHSSSNVLSALLENPHLRESHVTVLVSRRDLPRDIIQQIALNREWMKNYSLKLAVVKHPHTPRHFSFPMLKHLYLFDLMGIAATAGTPQDLRRQAEDAIFAQRDRIALGQRLTLARCGSSRIVGGLLNDPEAKVLEVALQNPRLTEIEVSSALYRPQVNSCLTDTLLDDTRWIHRRLVKLAVLRSEFLSLGHFMDILSQLNLPDLADVAEDPRIASNLRAYAAKLLKSRQVSQRRKMNDNKSRE